MGTFTREMRTFELSLRRELLCISADGLPDTWRKGSGLSLYRLLVKGEYAEACRFHGESPKKIIGLTGGKGLLANHGGCVNRT